MFSEFGYAMTFFVSFFLLFFYRFLCLLSKVIDVYLFILFSVPTKNATFFRFFLFALCLFSSSVHVKYKIFIFYFFEIYFNETCSFVRLQSIGETEEGEEGDIDRYNFFFHFFVVSQRENVKRKTCSTNNTHNDQEDEEGKGERTIEQLKHFLLLLISMFDSHY